MASLCLQKAALGSASPQLLLKSQWPSLTIGTRSFSTRNRGPNQSQRQNVGSSSRSSLGGPLRLQQPKLRTHAVNLFEGDYSDKETQQSNEDRGSYSNEQSRHSTGQKNEGVSGEKFEVEMEELVKWAKQSQVDYEERRKQWIEISKKPVRYSQIDERGRAYGRGGRKKASSRVWIQPGMGEVVVNRKELTEYFPRETHRESILSPFVATETCGAFDMQCYVQGGGLSGQAGAIRHGLARALNHYNPDLYRPPLKRLGYLTRDPRKVERKKVGKVKARKSPQWVRR